MVCQNCHKENRSIAKFCKWCGQPLASTDLLDKLIGLDDVKSQLKNIVDTYTFLRSRKDISNARISLNTIVIGETGTGKTVPLKLKKMQLLRLLNEQELKKYFWKKNLRLRL